jgi:ABC-type multidrug transport system fused ATPase/permease subunit
MVLFIDHPRLQVEGGRWLMQRCQRYSEDHSAAINRLNGAIIDVFTNITTVRLFARSRYEQTYVVVYQKDEQHQK